MIYHTSEGREIPEQIARELKELYDQIRGEHFAGRMWRELLSEDERVMLGGKFTAAFVKEPRGAVGMYGRLYPVLSLERAMLEVTRQMGWVHQARYDRLLDAVGEKNALLPGRGARPDWDGKSLFFNGQLVRQIKQPNKAFRIVQILNEFERQGWPATVEFKNLSAAERQRLREAVASLNKRSTQLLFRMDGTGAGVMWGMA